MNKKLIIGNWKMNPETVVEAREIGEKIITVGLGLERTITVIAPSFLHIGLFDLKKGLENLFLGAQSVSVDTEGAHTGEISAKMLKDFGTKYVIVGHSEERNRGVDDQSVSKKAQNVLENEMKPVICIGEKSRDNDAGTHYDFLKDQIKASLADIPKKYAKDIIIAYEPVWAIGASAPMSSDQICETVIFIRKVFADLFDSKTALRIPVLYGGSVNFKNAEDIIKNGKVDGLLVGRESVNVTGFSELLRVVDSL